MSRKFYLVPGETILITNDLREDTVEVEVTMRRIVKSPPLSPQSQADDLVEPDFMKKLNRDELTGEAA